MKKLLSLILTTTFCCYPASNAFADEQKPKGYISIQAKPAKDGALISRLRVTPASTSRPKLKIQESSTKKNLDYDLTATPANHWVMLDTSRTCVLNGLDKKLDELNQLLKKQLDSDSLLSLITYTKTTLEIHSNHRSPRKLETGHISCTKNAISTSFEKPLNHLKEYYPGNELPTVIWVFTAGNVQLSKASIDWLRKRDIEMHIVLYNPVMRTAVRSTIAKLRKELGRRNVRYSEWKKGSIALPESLYEMEIYPVPEILGKNVALKVSGTNGKRVLEPTNLGMHVPKRAATTLWSKYGKTAMMLLMVLLIGYGIFRIVRYYLPRSCGQCKRRLRYSDKRCAFCRAEGDAYLIGKFNVTHRARFGKDEVYQLNKRVTEIGTHRRSRISMNRPKGMRRAPLAKIVQERQSESGAAYKIVPLSDPSVVDLTVNGSPLSRERYLAKGDLIRANNLDLTFYAQGEK